MNEDCHRIIFNDLSLTDLLSLGKTSKFIENLVNTELDRQFSKKSVILSLQNMLPSLKDFTEFYDRVFVNDAANAVKLLKNFGKFIKILVIEHTVDIPEVYKLINYHSDSFLQIHLTDVPSFFKHITKPFKNVQRLELGGKFSSFHNDLLSFPELFPALRNLVLSKFKPIFVKREIMNQLIVELPNLFHLYVSTNTFSGFNLTSTTPLFTEKIIRKNLQIQSLALNKVSPDMCKIAAEELKSLEYLEIIGKIDLNHTIHFGSVKTFKYIENGNFVIKLSFSDKLEELNAVVNHVSNAINFVNNHKSLKKVQITKDFGLSDEDILQLVNIELNATEFYFNANDNVKEETIAHFIQNQHQIDYLSLKIHSSIQSVKEKISKLKQYVGNDWIIDNNNYYIIFSKRYEIKY